MILLESRAFRVEYDDGGVALMGQPESEAPHADAGGLDHGLADGRGALAHGEGGAPINGLHAELVPVDGHREVMRPHAGATEAHVAISGASDRENGFEAEVLSPDRRQVGYRVRLKPSAGIPPVLEYLLSGRPGLGGGQFWSRGRLAKSRRRERAQKRD